MMKRLWLLCICSLLSLSSCTPLYRYRFIDAASVKGIPADSLKWNYKDGQLTDLPLLDSHGEVVRLAVDKYTYLYVRTIEGVEHYFEMPSLVVEDHGDGLLGSNTLWRGIDARQRAERSVYVREISTAEIHSRHPAFARIKDN